LLTLCQPLRTAPVSNDPHRSSFTTALHADCDQLITAKASILIPPPPVTGSGAVPIRRQLVITIPPSEPCREPALRGS
jgi:hypothetical protein